MEKKKFGWLDRSEYPFESHYLLQGGAKQHYIDEGSGEVILFVHGTPSWSFDFRNVIKELSKRYRCLALDHIGFGLSDKTKDYPYSLKTHAENLAFFIEQTGLKNITLVLHDFGGPIGLEYALKHPENVARLVILNSWIGSSETDPEFIKFSKILKSPILPFLYLYFNFSARFLLPQSFGKHKISSKIRRHYTRVFGNKNERYGPLAFARSLINDQVVFERQWQNRTLLKDKPMLLIWGMKDRFAGPKYLERFEQGFSNSSVLKLEDCGHFPQEEEPQKVIGAIERFITKA